MIELVVLSVMALVALVVFGALASVVALLGWLIMLPFRMLGCIFHGLALVIALPLLVVFGVAGLAVFGAGFLMFLIPLLPFALLALFIVWLMKRRHGPARPLGA